jgi:hypothetical protein
MKLAQRILGMIAVVLVLVCAVEFSAVATPPPGISFTAVGRATLPEFNVKRKEKMLD